MTQYRLGNGGRITSKRLTASEEDCLGGENPHLESAQRLTASENNIIIRVLTVNIHHC